MNDNLDAIFYNLDHTKTYNPSGKPTGVVMTDFDIMEAKQAIQAHIDKKVNEVLDRVEEKATEYYDWSKSLEKEVERPFMAVPLERIKKLRSEL